MTAYVETTAGAEGSTGGAVITEPGGEIGREFPFLQRGAVFAKFDNAGELRSAAGWRRRTLFSEAASAAWTCPRVLMESAVRRVFFYKGIWAGIAGSKAKVGTGMSPAG